MTSTIVDPIGLNDADFENQRPSKAEYDIKGLALDLRLGNDPLYCFAAQGLETALRVPNTAHSD